MQLQCQFTMTTSKNDKSAIKIACMNSAVYANSEVIFYFIFVLYLNSILSLTITYYMTSEDLEYSTHIITARLLLLYLLGRFCPFWRLVV